MLFDLTQDEIQSIVKLSAIAISLVSVISIYFRDIRIPRKIQNYLTKIAYAKSAWDSATKLLSEYRILETLDVEKYINKIQDDDIIVGDPEADFGTFKELFSDEYKKFIKHTKKIKFSQMSKRINKEYNRFIDELNGNYGPTIVDLKKVLVLEIKKNQAIISDSQSKTGMFSSLYKNVSKIL